MSIPYEKIVAEDLRVGQAEDTVTVTMPAGGTSTGTPINLATFRDGAGYACASLPAASEKKGAFYVVNDATAVTPGSTVAGGGSNFVIVWSNGTDWKIVTG